MRTLVIDSATEACSVALFDDDTLFEGRFEKIGRGHAERLVPMIGELADRGRADRICVNTGPGSFTGLRIGISAARALAFAWQTECTGYGCLDLVAAMAFDSESALSTLTVTMAGGHGEYFIQPFVSGPVATSPLRSLPIETALNGVNGPVAGDVADRFAANGDTCFALLPDARCWPLIAHLTALPPAPLYGRAPDAKLPPSRAALR